MERPTNPCAGHSPTQDRQLAARAHRSARHAMDQAAIVPVAGLAFFTFTRHLQVPHADCQHREFFQTHALTASLWLWQASVLFATIGVRPAACQQLSALAVLQATNSIVPLRPAEEDANLSNTWTRLLTIACPVA